MLQGILLFILAYGVLLVNASAARGLRALDFVGTAVWISGFIFEAVGDAQLERFKKTPENAGKTMTSGLWRYTRHPNYFGEAVMWWGIYLIALSVPTGWTALVSPLLITFLLLRVSGVTMLEKNTPETVNSLNAPAGPAPFFRGSRKTKKPLDFSIYISY
jgi:steroid 5-alpha reductase family enzyme